MDTRPLRLFLALADHLHFGRAAEACGMSQPAFSRRIAGLERDLGARLVERDSRNVALTPAGERLRDDGREVLARLDAAWRTARLTAAGEAGELRFGFMMHAAHRIAPQLIARYAAIRPMVTLKLEEATPGEITAMLARGALDAAVTYAGRPAPAVEEIPLLRDRLALVAPAGHRLAALPRAAPEDVAGEALIATPAAVAAPLRLAIETWCERAGAPARFAYQPKLQHTILRLVAQGLGVALVPGSITEDLPAGVTARPLVDAPELSVALCAPRGSRNPALAPLLALARG